MIKSLKDSIGDIKGVSVVVADEVLTTGVELKELVDDYLLLTSKNKQQAQVGDDVEVTLYCANGVFNFASTVVKVENNFPYYFWYIKIPESFTTCQERQFYRTRFNIKALLSLHFHNGEKKVLECSTFDISGNGVSLMMIPISDNRNFWELLEKPDINKYANIGLCLYFSERNINARVQYVHSRDLSENSMISICAFKFINLAPSDCDFITKQCFSKQLLEQNKSKN